MSAWEVIAVSHEKRTGKIKTALPYSWLKPMDELHARKMAWACDVWDHTEIRVRPAGDTGIGEPHDWLKHAPPEFFEAFKK